MGGLFQENPSRLREHDTVIYIYLERAPLAHCILPRALLIQQSSLLPDHSLPNARPTQIMAQCNDLLNIRSGTVEPEESASK